MAADTTPADPDLAKRLAVNDAIRALAQRGMSAKRILATIPDATPAMLVACIQDYQRGEYRLVEPEAVAS
jgi:hypothetical protein